MGPVLVMGTGAILLLGFFYLLGIWGEDDEAPPAALEETATPTPTPRKAERETRTPARPREVRLRLVATGPVYVCLVNSRGRQVIDEETLDTGARTRVYESRFFRTNFGNDNVRMLVDGKSFSVEPSPDPIGYELRPGRRPRRLSDEARPDCSS
jgi:cytoskeleton protein RodZ